MQSNSPDAPAIVPDSQHKGILRLLPAAFVPYAQLARFDRPIGWWLLFWPGAFALALSGALPERWDLLLWFLIGAIAMRSAGCVYNDIVDRDLDARVERTATRPLASGAVSVKAAWGWLIALSGVGLIVLLQLTPIAQITALASLALVAAYPFMKRISWWPQAWLGLVFSWAAPVAWLSSGNSNYAAMAALYAGCILWVIGYDSIYALQDVEDDAMVGIKSSARAMGDHVRGGVAGFYAGALLLWGLAVWMIRPDPLAWLALLPAAAHLAWQVVTLVPKDGANALARFRANRTTGLLVTLAMATVGFGLR
jgi:4-hydroxybenzoate polyprenyltransferase